MENFYFRSDLESLVVSLERYAKREEIVDLLKSIDYMYNAMYNAKLPLVKLLSSKYYQKVLLQISKMMKEKISLDKAEGKTEFEEERAVLYSLRSYEKKKAFVIYKANRTTRNELSNREKSLGKNVAKR